MLQQVSELPSFLRVNNILLCVYTTFGLSIHLTMDIWVAPVVIQSLSHVQFFATPWTAVHQASLSFTTSWSLLRFMSIESVMLSNHLILSYPLLLLPSVFHSIRVFSKEPLFASVDQSVGASAFAPILPMNTEG